MCYSFCFQKVFISSLLASFFQLRVEKIIHLRIDNIILGFIDLMDHVMSVDVIAKTLWEKIWNCRWSGLFPFFFFCRSQWRMGEWIITYTNHINQKPSIYIVEATTINGKKYRCTHIFLFIFFFLPLCRSNHNSYFYAYLKQITSRKERKKNAVALPQIPRHS